MAVKQVADTQKSSKQEVVGWGVAGAPWASSSAYSLSRALATELHALGIEQAFGVLGGGIAPFAAGMAMSGIRFHHFRHEAGAGFAAIEASFESGKPTAIVVTTGPGLLNVVNPVMAARVDGARVLLISGFTSRPQVGRGAVQETSLASMPADLIRPGSLFHDACIPESPEELPGFLQRLARGFHGSTGWVAHLGLPLALQTKMLDGALRPTGDWTIALPHPADAGVEAAMECLKDPGAVLWLGHGALPASKGLCELIEAVRVPVVCSSRAKGVVPEDHPLFVGVTGAGGSRSVKRWFAHRPPHRALVIGTRLGEVTSFLAPELTPIEGWVQVDLSPSAFGAAFPWVGGLGVQAESSNFVRALLDRINRSPSWLAQRRKLTRGIEADIAGIRTPALVEAPREGTVRPSFLMQALQRLVVDGSDALVMSEAGTAFTWCNAGLQFREPYRYRTSAAWGSMGHYTTGCVGAALVGRRQVFTVVGDGAMLMNNEINTAVQYGARVVWVVLNDAQLGLNQHGMTALGMTPVETQMPRTDFVAFARSQGAQGIAAATEADLEAALKQALAADGPIVLDINVDPTIPSPVVADRIASLNRQAGVETAVSDEWEGQ